MRRISDFEHQQGWLTYATNTPEVDYLSQAYLLALSVKLHCKINKFAIAVAPVHPGSPILTFSAATAGPIAISPADARSKNFLNILKSSHIQLA